MESEPFSIKLKDPQHAKFLGEDFAKELGDRSLCLCCSNITEMLKL